MTRAFSQMIHTIFFEASTFISVKTMVHWDWSTCWRLYNSRMSDSDSYTMLLQYGVYHMHLVFELKPYRSQYFLCWNIFTLLWTREPLNRHLSPHFFLANRSMIVLVQPQVIDYTWPKQVRTKDSSVPTLSCCASSKDHLERFWERFLPLWREQKQMIPLFLLKYG